MYTVIHRTYIVKRSSSRTEFTCSFTLIKIVNHSVQHCNRTFITFPLTVTYKLVDWLSVQGVIWLSSQWGAIQLLSSHWGPTIVFPLRDLVLLNLLVQIDWYSKLVYQLFVHEMDGWAVTKCKFSYLLSYFIIWKVSPYKLNEIIIQ